MERAAQHLSILGIRAEYSNLTFDVQELSYVGDTQLLQINGARAGVKRGSLALQGSVDLGTLKTFAQIDAEGIPIAEFLRTLSSFLPKDLPKGLDGLA